MPKYYRNTLAEKLGIPYDIRTEMEVINDLNESGVKAYLNNQPYFLIHSDGYN